MNSDLWLILAGHTDEVARAFRNRGVLQENWLLISASIVIGSVWLALYLWEKLQIQRKASDDTPLGLFYDLCKTHRLSRTDINYLLKATEEHAMEQPALVFIDPGILHHYASDGGADSRYYEDLASKLFQR